MACRSAPNPDEGQTFLSTVVCRTVSALLSLSDSSIAFLNSWLYCFFFFSGLSREDVPAAVEAAVAPVPAAEAAVAPVPAAVVLECGAGDSDVEHNVVPTAMA